MYQVDNLFLAMTARERANTKLDIFILAGQSNADGTTKIANALPGQRDESLYENVRYCGRRPMTDGSYRYWDERFGPVREGLGKDTECIGPELGMAQVLNPAYAEPGKKAVILKVAAGGISIAFHAGMPVLEDRTKNYAKRFYERGSWYPLEDGGTDPFRPTGLLYRDLLAYTGRIYRELTALGFASVRFAALNWMQGEEDLGRYREYPPLFHALVRGLREKLTAVTGRDYTALPVIVGEVSATFHSSTRAQLEKNRNFLDMQNHLPLEDASIQVIPTRDFALTKPGEDGDIILGTDQWHWNYADMLSVGRLFGEASLKAAEK